MPIFQSRRRCEYPIGTLLRGAVSDPPVRRRLLFSAALAVVLQAALGLPHPLAADTAFGRIDLFALTIMPFLSACLLLQLLAAFVRPLRRLHGGEGGRRQNLLVAASGVAFGIASAQAFFLARAIVAAVPLSGGVPGNPLPLAATFVGAFAFLLVVAALNERYGVGNGIAFVVASVLLRRVAAIAGDVIGLAPSIGPASIVPVVAVFFAALLFAVWISGGQRVLTLSDRQGKGEMTLPIRISWFGTQPLGIAASLLLLPATLFQFVRDPSLEFVANACSFGWVHDVLFILLAFAIARFYLWVIWRSGELRALVGRYGFSLEGADAGEAGAREIRRAMTAVALVGAGALVIASVVPRKIGLSLMVPASAMQLTEALALLPLVGFVLDTLAQLEFFRKRREAGDGEWRVVAVAPDEIEALLARARLEERGVTALIEPSRFTWGMPIRTVVDSYRLHVPARERDAAQAVLRSEPLVLSAGVR